MDWLIQHHSYQEHKFQSCTYIYYTRLYVDYAKTICRLYVHCAQTICIMLQWMQQRKQQHRKCCFPGQHVISADRVIYKDDKIVRPHIQSVIESAAEPMSSASSDRNSLQIVCLCKLSFIRLVFILSSQQLFMKKLQLVTKKRCTPLTRFFVQDTIKTVTDMQLNHRIWKLNYEKLNTAVQTQERSCLQKFSNLNGGGRHHRHRWSTSCRRSCRGQPLVVTSVAGQQTGRLSYVTDSKFRLHLMVNNGPEVSIIPPSKAERKNRQDTFGLLVANNLPIVSFCSGRCFLDSVTQPHVITKKAD